MRPDPPRPGPARLGVMGSRPDVLDGGPAGQAEAAARRTVADLEGAGSTAVVVLAGTRPVGVVGLADQLRPDARSAVARLSEVTVAPAVLITGDKVGLNGLRLLRRRHWRP